MALRLSALRPLARQTLNVGLFLNAVIQFVIVASTLR
jgi:large-conductance mechanosensitive channel